MKKLLVTLLSIFCLAGLVPHDMAQAKTGDKSVSKTISGVLYKLTQPKVLKTGKEAAFEIRILNPQTGTPISNTSFSASFDMGDGMKVPVKVVKNKDGSFKLITTFTMGGEWTLQIMQTTPSKKTLKPFTINVD